MEVSYGDRVHGPLAHSVTDLTNVVTSYRYRLTIVNISEYEHRELSALIILRDLDVHTFDTMIKVDERFDMRTGWEIFGDDPADFDFILYAIQEMPKRTRTIRLDPNGLAIARPYIEKLNYKIFHEASSAPVLSIEDGDHMAMIAIACH